MLHEELPLEKCYFEFFCRHDLTLPHAKFHIYEIPLHVFFCKYSTKYMKLIIHSEIWTLLHHLEQIIIFFTFQLGMLNFFIPFLQGGFTTA